MRNRSFLWINLLVFWLSWGVAIHILAQKNLALEVLYNKGGLLNIDKYGKYWQKGKDVEGLGIGLRYRTEYVLNDSFAKVYNYPEWALQLLYYNMEGVTMHKKPSELWGTYFQEANYDSHLGKVFALNLQFSRPLFRKKNWTLGYSLGMGGAYNTFPYHPQKNVDNELTGSPFLIYFEASPFWGYQFAKDFHLRLDLPFRHVSNGATYRPNKGANFFTPNLSIQYDFVTYSSQSTESYRYNKYKKHYWQVDLTLGGKTLLEDWLLTYLYTPSSSPNYRSHCFKFYPSFSLKVNHFWRYHLKYASGIGLDLFYGLYAKRILEIENQKISPLSLGLSAKHKVFYKQFSLDMGLGFYLFRQRGKTAQEEEKPFYETIGLSYHFKDLPLSLGAEVKAHGTKADHTNLVVGLTF